MPTYLQSTFIDLLGSKYLRTIRGVINKVNTLINPVIPEKSHLNDKNITSPYDMIEKFLRVTMIETENKEIYRYKIEEKFTKDYTSNI